MYFYKTFYFFKKPSFFWSSVRFTAKLRRHTESSYYSFVSLMHCPLLVNLHHKSGTFVSTTDEQTMIDTSPTVHRLHYSPLQVLYIYRFGQMHNGIYLSLYYNIDIFLPKILCALPIHASTSSLPPPPILGNHWSFQCLYSFSFSRVFTELESCSMQPFQIGLIHLLICFKLPPWLFMAW